MKIKWVLGRAIMVGFLVFAINTGILTPAKKVEAASKKTYTITTNTKPVGKQFIKSKNYNAKTKHYYLLRSYMELLEKQGGGTLVLKKGVYKITNTICVPSNVTIKLSKGTILQKLNSTGVKAMKASGTMFYLVPPSKSNKKNATYGYKGARNITIIGEEGSAIDMGGSSSNAIYMAHSYNILIKGITFKNVKGSNYIITVNGCNKVRIYYCNFSGQKSKTVAILLEIPAKGKKQTQAWVKQDNTVNNNINICRCNFTNLYRGIISARFVKDKYHTKINILNNRFQYIGDDVIRAINWDAPVIQNNTFDTAGTGAKIIKGLDSFARGIYLGGVKNPVVSENKFSSIPLPIMIGPYDNSDSELKKANKSTKNTVNSAQIVEMYKKNSCINSVLPYVRYLTNSKTQNYKYYFYEEANKTYTVSPDSLPYKLDGMVLSTYNEYTKQHYMLQSYLNQIEANGGGTLVLKAGVYKVPVEVAVGSNTTIRFESGAYVQHTEVTGSKNLLSTSGVFALVSPNGKRVGNKYSGYSGAKNIKFIGPDTKDGGIDVNGRSAAAILLCHNYNVTFDNVHFKNHNGGHFIELDASRKVLIKNCVFKGYRVPSSGSNEAINLDIPDKSTGGFVRTWTKYDKTADDDIIIENNIFHNLTSAIGSHHYTDGPWHTNVIIRNNSFSNISYYPIRVMQMDAPVIENNIFTNIGINRPDNATYSIFMSGVKNPVIRNNTIKDSNAYIAICLRKITGNAILDSYPVLKNIVTKEQLNMMKYQNQLINVERNYIYYTTVLNPTMNQVTKYYIQ